MSLQADLASFHPAADHILNASSRWDLASSFEQVRTKAQAVAHACLHIPGTEPITIRDRSCTWIESSQEETALQGVIYKLNQIATHVANDSFSAIASNFEAALQSSKNHVRVNLESAALTEPLSLIMNKDAVGQLSTHLNPQEILNIDCQKIDPQVMFRFLVLLREKSERLRREDFLKRDHLAFLEAGNPLLKMMDALIGQGVNLLSSKELFDREEAYPTSALDYQLQLHAAADYLCVDTPLILEPLMFDLSQDHRHLSLGMLAHLAEGTRGLLYLEKLHTNIQAEVLSRGRQNPDIRREIERFGSVFYSPFTKKRFPSMSAEERSAHLLQSMKDGDDVTFDALSKCFASDKPSLDANFYQTCIHLGKSAVRRALFLDVLFDNPKGVDLLLNSPLRRYLFRSGKYGLIEALKQGAKNQIRLSTLNKILPLVNIPEWEPNETLRKKKLLELAVLTGNLPLTEQAINALENVTVPLEGKYGLGSILLGATRSGSLEVFNAAKALLNGRTLPLEGDWGLGYILSEAARSGYLDIFNAAKALLNNRALPLEGDYGLGDILLKAAQRGSLEVFNAAKALLNNRTLPLEGNWGLGHILSYAAGRGSLEVFNAAKSLLNDRTLPLGGYPGLESILSAAARSGSLEVFNAVKALLNDTPLPLEGPYELGRLVAAASSGSLEVFNAAKALLNDTPLPLEGEYGLGHILVAAALRRSLEIFNVAKALLNGRTLPLEGDWGLGSILFSAALRGSLEVFNAAKALLNDRALPLEGEAGLGDILASAAYSGSLEVFNAAKSLLNDRPLPLEDAHGLGGILASAVLRGSLEVFNAAKALLNDRPPPLGGDYGPGHILSEAGRNGSLEVFNAAKALLNDRILPLEGTYGLKGIVTRAATDCFIEIIEHSEKLYFPEPVSWKAYLNRLADQAPNQAALFREIANAIPE